MQRGTITDEDRQFVETWENLATYSNAIIRFDVRGEEKHEVITGRRSFMLTTAERTVTQDRIADEKDDPFLNGSFRPVVVPESVTIESNPNALSDDAIQEILVSSDLAWSEWLQTLDSEATLRRMIEFAEGADISLKRYKELEARLREVHPQARIQTNDPHLRDFLSGRTANSQQQQNEERRHQSGRSSDYR